MNLCVDFVGDTVDHGKRASEQMVTNNHNHSHPWVCCLSRSKLPWGPLRLHLGTEGTGYGNEPATEDEELWRTMSSVACRQGKQTVEWSGSRTVVYGTSYLFEPRVSEQSSAPQRFPTQSRPSIQPSLHSSVPYLRLGGLLRKMSAARNKWVLTSRAQSTAKQMVKRERWQELEPTKFVVVLQREVWPSGGCVFDYGSSLDVALFPSWLWDITSKSIKKSESGPLGPNRFGTLSADSERGQRIGQRRIVGR